MFDIICIGTVEWLVIHSLPEYTMLGLAKTHRVLFVEPFASAITLARMARWQKRARVSKPQIEQVGPNLWVYRPPPIGAPGITRWEWASNLNGWILSKLLKRVAQRLGFKDPVLWSYLYNSASLLRNFPARLKIYECGDEDSALARDDRQRALVKRMEQATCESADIVFAVTHELVAARRAYNPRTFEVNCAADLAFFGRAQSEETQVAPAIAKLAKPVIGYLGGVDPWKMDIDLLTRMARAHPDWSIALVGYVWFGFDQRVFSECRNIHVLGPQDYADFPRFLKGMDVCIMPFPLNDITRNGDALKLYEYLAGGRPVVSTRVPAAVRLADIVRIADTVDDFIKQVERALLDGPDAFDKRMSVIARHSWDHRNQQKTEIIADRLAQTSSGR